MMRKKASGRKSGGAAGIEVVEVPAEQDQTLESEGFEAPKSETVPPKPKRRANVDQESNGNLGIAEIRKAAAFANSIGGLDKAIALFQILKVAKEVQ